MRRQPNIIEKICAHCGEAYRRTESYFRNQERKGHNSIYCSVKCQREDRRTTNCKYCGSKELIDLGWKNRQPVCANCLNKWKRERHLRVKKCWLCEIEFKQFDRVKNNYCKKCRCLKLKSRIYIIDCIKCGSKFVTSKNKKTVCNTCNSRFSGSKNGSYVPFGRKCSKCGDIITDKNRTQSIHQSKRMCDVCLYINRRTSKDRSIYGIENEDVLKKIRDIEAVSLLGIVKTTNGGHKCLKTKKMQIARARTILKSGH